MDIKLKSKLCQCGHSIDSHYLLENFTTGCSQLNDNLLLKLAGISWCTCSEFRGK